MKALVVSVFCAVIGTSVSAFEALPESQCTPVYTVQKEDCRLERISLCNDNSQSVIQHIEIEVDELDSVDFYTEDYSLFKAFKSGGSVVLGGVTENRDALSFDTIASHGSDRADQRVLFNLPVFVDLSPVDVTMEYRLIGETIEIDGVTFEKGTFEADLDFVRNTLTGQVEGAFLLDRTSRTMIETMNTFNFMGVIETEHFPVVRVLQPHDPDYNDDSLIYQCEIYSLKSSLRNLAKG